MMVDIRIELDAKFLTKINHNSKAFCHAIEKSDAYTQSINS